MSSEFGKLLKVSVFGQSHGKAIGVNIDGLPAGEPIDLEELNAFLDRRKTGKNALSTQRKEADLPRRDKTETENVVHIHKQNMGNIPL